MQTSESSASTIAQGGGKAAPLTAFIKRRWPQNWRGDHLTAFLVLLPSIIAVAVFVYGFILWTFRVSFTNWSGWSATYDLVGLDNWKQLFLNDERWFDDLRNLVEYAIVFMPLCMVGGFLMAALLNQRIKGEAFFRTVFVFPFAVSGIVTGVVWRWLFYPPAGLNLILGAVGLGFLQNKWYAANYGTMAIALAAAWQFTGYVMSLYLAALRGINNELLEAAQIDGATTWNVYRNIVIPMLSPVTFTAIVLTGMGSIRVFDLVVAISGSGAGFTTDTMAFYMFQSIFQTSRFAQGAVIAAFMIILSAFLVGPYLMSMSREVE
jgi:glucose/mannose transport system permease protein